MGFFLGGGGGEGAESNITLPYRGKVLVISAVSVSNNFKLYCTGTIFSINLPSKPLLVCLVVHVHG